MTPLAALAIAFGCLAYYALQKRAAKLAQPLRLQIADIGQALLAREDLTDGVRRQVNLLLKTAFGAHVFIALVYFIAPFAIPYLILFRGADRVMSSMWRDTPDDVRAAYEKMNSLHTTVMFANNPIMMFILVVEVALISALVFLVAVAFSRRTLPQWVSLDLVVSRIAQRTPGFEFLYA